MREVFAGILEILYESAPFLIVGFALAGVLHVVLTRFPRITAQLTGTGRRPVFMAALLGAPMPLCSCSVLPAALALRRKGAGKGATASFLVSVPETDVVSILITFAMIGPFVGVYRPLAAVASALATGLVIRRLELRERSASIPTPAPAAACGCENDAAGGHAEHVTRANRPWWRRAFDYGFIEIFDDIAPQLVLGILLAAVIGAWLPDLRPGFGGGTVVTYLAMVAVGIPLYVCAAASTPIAAGLIAGGVSPGAAMVFLLAGPATNLGSLVVLRGEFGPRILAVYVGMIAVTSVACGALLDLLIGKLAIPPVVALHDHAATPLGVACTVVLAAWIALSFHRSRLLPRLRGRLERRLGRAALRERL